MLHPRGRRPYPVYPGPKGRFAQARDKCPTPCRISLPSPARPRVPRPSAFATRRTVSACPWLPFPWRTNGRRSPSAYQGVPAAGLRIGKNRYGERTFFSETGPTRPASGCRSIDHPYDKATSEFVVTAPAQYQVVANGLLQEETDLGDGQRRTHWKQSVPIASWLNALGVAQFASRHAGPVNGRPARDLGLPPGPRRRRPRPRSPGPAGARVLHRAHRPVPVREARQRRRPPGSDGGMEHATSIFYGERRSRAAASRLVAHEIAHQWFGDSVTETRLGRRLAERRASRPTSPCSSPSTTTAATRSSPA